MKQFSLCCLLVLGWINFSFVPQGIIGLKVGDRAAEFNLKSTNDRMVSLSGLKNVKGAIIIFTCNHCPYSIAYEDRIIALHQKYATMGYPVIAINPNDPVIAPDDSFDKMKERAKEKSFPFDYLYDQTQETAKAYGATRTPHVFILSKKNDVFKVEYIGAIDDNTHEPDQVKVKYVEDAMQMLMTGNTPATTTTKAIGCTIKWRKTE